MKKLMKNEGFTLIELLLVVVIIGLMLAVIVPRAWRANIDTKYGLVRQNCSELASFGMEWAEKMVLAQDDNLDLGIKNYLDTLSTPPNGQWVANSAGNWVGTNTVPGRQVDGQPANPETSVQGIIAPEKIPRNPFNGASVFVTTNDPATMGVPVPGAAACGSVDENAGNFTYYAFVFQGTDSTSTTLTDTATFYAGQSLGNIPGLRNGIFFARIAAATGTGS